MSTKPSAPARAVTEVGDRYAHTSFHLLAVKGDARNVLAGLFVSGFQVGASLALVDPDVARSLVDEIAEPESHAVLAAVVDEIRSAS